MPTRQGATLSAEQVEKMGYPIARQLDDGRWLAVAAMTFGKGRLYFDLDLTGADCCYCYKTLDEAVNVLMTFNPAKEPEPDGWFKCPTDNRIRPDGDKSKETIGYPPP